VRDDLFAAMDQLSAMADALGDLSIHTEVIGDSQRVIYVNPRGCSRPELTFHAVGRAHDCDEMRCHMIVSNRPIESLPDDALTRYGPPDRHVDSLGDALTLWE